MPPSSSTRKNQYWLPAENIAREVITADIARYLGNDALVKPSPNPEGRSGYLITAYRPLTSEMIADLKADSKSWQAERLQAQQSRSPGRYLRERGSTGSPDSASVSAPSYDRSRTRHESLQQYPPDRATTSGDSYEDPYDGEGSHGQPPPGMYDHQHPPQGYGQFLPGDYAPQSGYGGQEYHSTGPEGYPPGSMPPYVSGVNYRARETGPRDPARGSTGRPYPGRGFPPQQAPEPGYAYGPGDGQPGRAPHHPQTQQGFPPNGGPPSRSHGSTHSPYPPNYGRY
ncbi:MAG: hypothetical protein M1817_000824 [Caeruleum heppii]|nr:MAG: hypothetical protein M1817_000824 [Caeruleum heppii]